MGHPGNMADPGQADNNETQQERPWWDEAGAMAEPSPLSPPPPEPELKNFGTAPLPELHEPPADLELEPDGTRTLIKGSVPSLAALRSRRELAAAAQRDVGRVREINQDNAFAMVTSVPRESSNVQLGLFVVADGMGGHEGGEVASRLAVRTVTTYILEYLLLPALDESFSDALQPLMIAAVQEANQAIYDHARSLKSDMGTTCSAVLLLGSAIYVAHVGDSRVYVRTPTGLRQITDDHSAVGRLIQLGQISHEEAREHPMRSQLYRTVGQQLNIPVDFIYHSIADATHILLCSDGLWSMVDDDIIDDVLDQNLWPQDACKELIARANLAGGEDNISAVVVTLPSAGG